MSLVGALTGFGVMSIIVGVIGSVVAGIMWFSAVEDNSYYVREKNTRHYPFLLGMFVVMLFLGSILVGGL